MIHNYDTIIFQCVKNARILVFSDSYLPVWRQNGSFRPYTRKYILEKTLILIYFTQYFFCKEECNSSLHVTQPNTQTMND